MGLPGGFFLRPSREKRRLRRAFDSDNEADDDDGDDAVVPL